MANALPLGTVRTWKRGFNDARRFEKVSHLGDPRKRWKLVPCPQSPGERLAQALRDPAIEGKRRKGIADKVPKSNRERARIRNRQTIREAMWYPIVYGPITIRMQLKGKQEEVTVPGLVIMMPFRTLHQAEKWSRANGYPAARVVRGVKLNNREYDGFRRHIHDEGRTWGKRGIEPTEDDLPEVVTVSQNVPEGVHSYASGRDDRQGQS